MYFNFLHIRFLLTFLFIKLIPFYDNQLQSSVWFIWFLLIPKLFSFYFLQKTNNFLSNKLSLKLINVAGCTFCATTTNHFFLSSNNSKNLSEKWYKHTKCLVMAAASTLKHKEFKGNDKGGQQHSLFRSGVTILYPRLLGR